MHSYCLKSIQYLLMVTFATVSLAAEGAQDISLSPQEKRVIELIRENVAAQSGHLFRDFYEWSSCFKIEGFCPPSLAASKDFARSIILMKNREYRTALALMNSAQVQQGHFRLSLPGLPYLTPAIYLTHDNSQNNSEYLRILGLIREDQQAIRTKLALTKELPNEAVPSPPANERAKLESQARTLYEVQVRALLQGFPFLNFLDSVRPTDSEISEALAKASAVAHREEQLVRDLEETPSSDILFFYANAEAVMAENPALRSTYESLRTRLAPEAGFLAWFKKSKLTMAATVTNGCWFASAVASIVISEGFWPLSLACGVASVSLATKYLAQSALDLRRAQSQWMLGQKTAGQLAEKENDFIYRAIVLSMSSSTLASVWAGARIGLTGAIRSAQESLKTSSASFGQVGRALVNHNANVIRFDSKTQLVSYFLSGGGRADLKQVRTWISGRSIASVTLEASVPVTFADVVSFERRVAFID